MGRSRKVYPAEARAGRAGSNSGSALGLGGELDGSGLECGDRDE